MSATTTAVALTLADAVEAMARAELDENTTVPAITRAIETLSPHLPAAEREVWWTELKRCLARVDDVTSSGPAAGEDDIDWQARAAEALDVLTGAAHP